MSSLSRFAHLIKSPPNPVYLLKTGLLACLLTTLTLAQAPGSHENLELTVKAGDYWWVGVVNHGDRMPLREAYQADFNSNYGNQVQPLMLSNKGEVIWSEHPWQLDFSGAKIRITGRVSYHREGGSLKEAYQFASRT